MPPIHLPLQPSRSLITLTKRTFTTTRASHIAKITIVGRLGAEPELTPTSTGQDVIRYVVGTNSGPRDNRQTSWWRVASFAEEGKGRERIMGLGKGTLVYVEGEATMRKYQTKEGKTESALSLIQQKLEVLKRPEEQHEGGMEEGPHE